MKLPALVFGCVLALGCYSASAQYDHEFTGAAGTAGVGDWNTAGNLDPSGPPTAGERVLIQSGKVAKVEAGNASIRELVIEGEVHIIDRTLTVGNGSAATSSGGTIRFKDNTGARESVLKVEDNTTFSNVTIITDAGKVGLITWADAKTDEVTFSSTTLEGSIHLEMNATASSIALRLVDDDDVMLLGPEADPDAGDSNFNAYTMSGTFGTDSLAATVQHGTLRVQRMNVNGMSGFLKTGRNSAGNTDLATTEIRYYSNAATTANATGISFTVFSYGVLDLKTNVAGEYLDIDDQLNTGVGGVVKVSASRIARFEAS